MLLLLTYNGSYWNQKTDQHYVRRSVRWHLQTDQVGSSLNANQMVGTKERSV